MSTAKKSRTTLVVGLVSAVGIFGCCLSCGLLFWYGKTQSDQEIAPFAPLVSACAGQAVPGTAAVGTAGGGVRAQVVKDGRVIAYSLPAEQRSASLAQTELVVCPADAERYHVETCEYDTGIITGALGGHNVIERYGYRREVRVVSASTGLEVARRTFEGDPPDPCPTDARFDRGGETQTETGSAPDDADMHAWLGEVARAGR